MFFFFPMPASYTISPDQRGAWNTATSLFTQLTFLERSIICTIQLCNTREEIVPHRKINDFPRSFSDTFASICTKYTKPLFRKAFFACYSPYNYNTRHFGGGFLENVYNERSGRGGKKSSSFQGLAAESQGGIRSLSRIG